MSLRKSVGVVIVFAAVAFVFGAGAEADTVMVDANFANISPGLNVNIHLTQPGSDFNGTVRTGVNNWMGSDGPDYLNGSFQAFCIEIRQYLDKTSEFEIRPLDVAPVPDYPAGGQEGMGPDRANNIRKLWGEYFDDIFSDPNTTTQAINAAAFQLAVWELVYEDGATFSVLNDTADDDSVAGTFYVNYGSSGAVGLANSWLSAIQADIGADKLNKANLIALTNDHYQDMVTVVPLPAGAGMGLVGLALVMWRRKRRVA